MIFWTLEQMPQIEQLEQEKSLPSEIIEEMRRILKILDTEYNSARDFQNDDGGYIILQRDSEEEALEQYQALLKGRHLREGDEEYCDVLQCRDSSIWEIKLFLVTNDYGVTVIRRMKGESN